MSLSMVLCSPSAASFSFGVESGSLRAPLYAFRMRHSTLVFSATPSFRKGITYASRFMTNARTRCTRFFSLIP
uniref:Uncharacterized protein n=1 Tax=Ixodes ricinus TaxID=34613 RepID=A0A147BKE6_IXORI